MDEKDKSPRISRRDLLKVSAAATATTAVTACGGGSSSSGSSPTNQPNVLFILVDQMRFPKFFPSGVTTVDQFLQKFMPNTYALWQSGVKFANHHITATACGPSRATLVTGLYTQQTWNAATYAPILGNTPPKLSPDMPTYGKLFQAAGYQTPYMGKWHLSEPWVDGMAQYGFDGLTEQYELDAANLQGTYGDPNWGDPPGSGNDPQLNDAFIAEQAASWLGGKRVGDRPWCLTVGLQNPHDYQFFPAGTEYNGFKALFTTQYAIDHSVQAVDYANTPSATGVTAGVGYLNNIYIPANLPSNGYPVLPPNYETPDTLWANKPKFQTVARQWNGWQFGGVTADSANTTTLTVVDYPGTTHKYSGYNGTSGSNSIYGGYTIPNGIKLGIGLGSYDYWQRGMDAYTQAMKTVDHSIGRVLNSIPADVAKNTIVIFTSDHGEEAGSHGFISSKAANVYDETIRVPLIVKDPTSQFAGDVATVRNQLTSAVDLVSMMVSFAYGGTRSWLTGDNATLYGKRFDMFPVLKSATATGREYALFSTDETITLWQDFATAPAANGVRTACHVLGLITPKNKLSVYSNWTPGTVDIANDGLQEGEFYDYETTDPNKLEMNNTYGSSSKVAALKTWLLNDLVPNEMRAALPTALRPAQDAAKAELINYYKSQGQIY